MEKEKLMPYGCPVEAAMNIIGGKYKVIIIWNLIGRTLRYNELKKAIPQVTPKMLSQQLKDLEADGIVNRILYPVVPPKTEYSLTEVGDTLVPIIEDLCVWGRKYHDVFQFRKPVTEEPERTQKQEYVSMEE